MRKTACANPLEQRGGEHDPRVRTRIERAGGMSAVEYFGLRAARSDLIARVAALVSGFDALLMLAVAVTAPPIAAFDKDEDYRRLNALLPRNTSAVNSVDGCAVSLPVSSAGPPVGLMVVGLSGADRQLLAVARGIEAAIDRTRSHNRAFLTENPKRAGACLRGGQAADSAGARLVEWNTAQRRAIPRKIAIYHIGLVG